MSARQYPLGKSGFRGVDYHANSQLWRARCCGRETYHLTPEAAAKAYDRLARQLFGSSAILNFPEEKTHA